MKLILVLLICVAACSEKKDIKACQDACWKAKDTATEACGPAPSAEEKEKMTDYMKLKDIECRLAAISKAEACLKACQSK